MTYEVGCGHDTLFNLCFYKYMSRESCQKTMIGILAMQGIICLYLLIFTGILESIQINNKQLRLLVLLNCME